MQRKSTVTEAVFLNKIRVVCRNARWLLAFIGVTQRKVQTFT